MSIRTPTLVLLWLVTGLEVLTMGLAGATKFMNAAMWQEHFASWGYPVWLTSVVGVAELVGVVLLLIPGTALGAAGGLIVIMIGALGTVLPEPPPQVLDVGRDGLARAMPTWKRRRIARPG